MSCKEQSSQSNQETKKIYKHRAASGLSGFTRATGERAILPLWAQAQKLSLHPVPLNTKRYQPKQWQAVCRTNPLATASTTGFQRDESLWAHPPVSPDTQTASGLSGFTRATGERAILPLSAQVQKLSLHPVPLNTKKYRPKQRQARSLTNQIAIASTAGFQRDESLWA